MTVDEWSSRFVKQLYQKVAVSSCWTYRLTSLAESSDPLGDLPNRYPADPEAAADELVGLWTLQGARLN